ncbi:hypothetical protein CA54_37370 [Symmachiella macrocystis]|uniref:Uncharacterized protein n=1 Tax=Symmachiella macrocystis TaxID=2527985 RepID=A0A5C6BT30_9PLAN|nr:hypothetical protein [Symmachiella macrocystis]TWU14867.1 hypothetical protein CA54_37370 [Symmachiella macrocystis]
MPVETEHRAAPMGPLMSAAYVLLAALAMAYGWGYRGTVGHEYGAMVPGALLGMMLCLGSGRLDWQRRAAVVGLFAAVGWAWGGSMSYMEQTFYVLSDSYPDVLYGFAVLFFIGGLWAGCGGALLGLGLTESRSELASLTRVFIVVCLLYFAAFLDLLLVPAHRDAYITFTVKHMHNGDWLSATLTLVASALYWIARPQDRNASALFLWGAVAWWVGYGVLTQLGGLRLGPLHRSESWGGVVGILVVFLIYLIRKKNRAALMLSLYGCVGGGLAFVLAVYIHNALMLRWGPVADMQLVIPAWRTAEVTFGFFMGLIMAGGVLRLLRDGIQPPVEDCPRAPLDACAVLVMMIVLPWINFRRHFARLLRSAPPTEANQWLGLSTGGWIVLLGILLTVPAVYLLWRYRRGDRSWAPPTAFGKGAAVVLFLLWGTAAAQLFDGYPTRQAILGHLLLWLPAALATCLLVSFVPTAPCATEPMGAMTSSNDSRWRVGWPFIVCCALMPGVILAVAGTSVFLQEKSAGERGRLRFGPKAYWRQTERLQGTWNVVGIAAALDSSDLQTDNLPLSRLIFDANRHVNAVTSTGETIDEHRWFLKDQFIWLQWVSKANGHEQAAEIPLQFQKQRLYIAWPPRLQNQGFLILERAQPSGA